MLTLTLLVLSPVDVVPRGTTFVCTPDRVWDGDGPLWCREGPRVRLAGIAARERGGDCRINQPCPAASAERARDALVGLVGQPIGRSREGHVMVTGPKLTCRSDGDGRGNRTAAWCKSARAGDLSCAMLKTGTVLKWQRYWRNHRCDAR